RRRMEAGRRRPAGMEPLRPGPIREKLHGPGRLAAGDAEGGGDAVGIEAEDDGGRRGGTERTARPGRVEPASIVRRRAERDGEPGGDLVAGDGRVQERV